MTSRNDTHSQRRRRYVYSLGLYFVSLLFAGYGVAYLYSAVHSWRLSRSESSWAATDATITSWTLDMGTGARGGSTWSPEWRYTYQVAGHLYSASSHGVSDGYEASWEERKYAVRDAEAKPIGSSVRVYYDPENPQRSVLDRRNFGGWAVFRSVFPFLFVLAIAASVASTGTSVRKI